MIPPAPISNGSNKPTDNTSCNIHHQLQQTITDFDRIDIGERIDVVPSDLKDIRSILITGGAGFMYVLEKGRGTSKMLF
jgi:hypothetical protein